MNIPMDERPLGIHEIKFVVEPSPSFGDGRRVADHANCSRDFGDVRPGNGGRWLIINSHLKTKISVPNEKGLRKPSIFHLSEKKNLLL